MSEVLIGGIEKRKIVILGYDPSWPEKFQQHAAIISQALGPRALAIEHIGSTSVPGLAAKPIVDIDVLVEDSSNEDDYLPNLLAAGYVLRVREPDWHEHRMFRTPELDVHVHIFSPGCPEAARHITFRNWLRSRAEDRLRYEALKRKLPKDDWPDMNAYAGAKSELVEEIIARASQTLLSANPARSRGRESRKLAGKTPPLVTMVLPRNASGRDAPLPRRGCLRVGSGDPLVRRWSLERDEVWNPPNREFT